MISIFNILVNRFRTIRYHLFLRELQAKYFFGEGIEIGPGAYPIGMKKNTIFCDKFEYWKRKFPVTICDADDLPFSDGQFDFLISAHMLEHSPNPLKDLREWKRVLKKNGVIVILLPHGERTFDKGREITSYEHLLNDYLENAQHGDTFHKNEFFRHVPKAYNHSWLKNMTGDLKKDWKFLQINGHIHYHVFNQSSFVEVLLNEGFFLLEVKDIVPGRIDSFLAVARNAE